MLNATEWVGIIPVTCFCNETEKEKIACVVELLLEATK